MSLAHGGHLTHGAAVNLSGKIFNAAAYGLDAAERIDYDDVAAKARSVKPRMIVAGASAYSRVIDWARFRAIADEVGALLMVDMAHYAGLIAAGAYPNPVPHADFVTSTTHKTLRGPRGGFVLAREKYAKALDSSVFPRLQGGPLMHVIAAKALAFHEAALPAFAHYQRQVIANARTLAGALERRGLRIVSGGTDCHLFLVDLRPKGITGKDAESALGLAHLTVNKNAIPGDPQKPTVTSGIRIGTAALTTRGMGESTVRDVANCIADVLERPSDPATIERVRSRVRALCREHPVYGSESR
ncbi:MAG TPA: serine hydroxymethyltransferase, partial [Usitatibacter sp.]|nr:serine hydroxymethyltransferase [Usitatibacter sp.]